MDVLLIARCCRWRLSRSRAHDAAEYILHRSAASPCKEARSGARMASEAKLDDAQHEKNGKEEDRDRRAVADAERRVELVINQDNQSLRRSDRSARLGAHVRAERHLVDAVEFLKRPDRRDYGDKQNHGREHRYRDSSQELPGVGAVDPSRFV